VNKWPDWILLGNSPFVFYESWWGSSLINFGLVWYMANLFLIGSLVLSVARQLAGTTDRVARSVLLGILVLCAFSVFGSTNLPLFAMFPENFLFFVLTFLVVFNKIDWESPQNLPQLSTRLMILPSNKSAGRDCSA
jgi:hypothetical protein